MKKILLTLLSILLCINVFAQNETYYSQGVDLINEGEYEQAVEVLTQSIESRETPEWLPYLLRSIAYSNTQKITSALNDTEIALQKINSDKQQKKDKIYWIYSVRAEIFSSTEDYSKAVSEITTSIKFSPSKAITKSLLKMRGDYHFWNKNYGASIKDYNQVLKQDKTNTTMKVLIVRSIVTEQESQFYRTGKSNTAELKKALTLADEVIAAEPDFDAAYKFRVRANVLMNNYGDAIRDAYRFRESYSTIVTSLSGDDRAIYAEKLFFQCADLDSAAAEKILLEKMDNTPDNPLPCYLLALLYADEDNHTKGIEMLTQAINRTDRELGDLLIMRARFYYSNKDYESALNDLHIAKQQNDSNTYIYYLEGNFYNKMEKWEDAAKSFGEGIRLRPDVSELYVLRANDYIKMKNFELAQNDMDSALKLDTTDIDVLVSYAYFYMEKGDRKTSNEMYQKVLNVLDSVAEENELNNEYLAMIYNNIAYNYVKLGDYEQAMTYVQKALDYDDESGYIWDTRGELYFCLKKYEECIADMNKSIEMRNEDGSEPANSYYYRGRARLELGQTEDGNADIQKAADLKHEEAMEFLKDKN